MEEKPGWNPDGVHGRFMGGIPKGNSKNIPGEFPKECRKIHGRIPGRIVELIPTEIFGKMPNKKL